VSATMDPWESRLSEHLDGTLSPEERSLLDAHLVTCGECRATRAELERVVAQARALPGLAPAADLWPGIEARVAALAQDAAPEIRSRRPAAARRGITLSWPQLVAAGLLLVALSGGGAWLAMRAPRFAGKAQPAGFETAGGTNYAAAHQDADPAYAAEVADLEKALSDRRNQLDPATVKTIEANLKIIDLATTQARQALAADPANPYLKEYLSKSMRRKVELLKQATEFASTR
jgi:predicted anti-sigma-YlaC factor YlaD